MKLIAKVLLTIITIPVFLIFLLCVNIRFQLLVPSFWEKSFASYDVYSKLSQLINENLETQVVTEGGKTSDVEILTDIISPANLQDTVNKNINNFLEYANGKAPDLIIYVPINKIPKSLISQNPSPIKEQMTANDLIKEVNLTGITPSQIKTISSFGSLSWICLFFVISLLVLILCLLYNIAIPGKRLTPPGVALILSGLVGLVTSFLAMLIENSLARAFSVSIDMVDSLMGIVIQPIIQGILKLWIPLSIGVIILGILLLFIKKPGVPGYTLLKSRERMS